MLNTNIETLKLATRINSLKPIINPVAGIKTVVPALFSRLFEHAVPIYPLVHNDSEIGFNYWHVHFDFRFFHESEIRFFRDKGDRHKFVLILQPEMKLEFVERSPLRRASIPSDVLACGIAAHTEIQDKLRVRNKNKKLIDKNICPHKGHKFDSSCIRGHGDKRVLHCPLHGLKFLVQDGRLLRCGRKYKISP